MLFGALGDFGKEVSLAHVADVRVPGGIFDRHAPPQDVLGLSDAPGYPQRLGPREGNRKQVIELMGVAAGGQVVGIVLGLQLVHQGAHRLQEGGIDGTRAPQAQRHPVQGDRTPPSAQAMQRRAVTPQPVLGRDLEEIRFDGRQVPVCHLAPVTQADHEASGFLLHAASFLPQLASLDPQLASGMLAASAAGAACSAFFSSFFFLP